MLRKRGFPIGTRFEKGAGFPIPVRNGAIAQLGERLNGIQEVVGSIPIGSTNKIK